MGEEKKSETSSDDYNPEYYDEEGKYIWGEEGVDWEFYDEEDRIAYHEGLSTVPETLNSQALPEQPDADSKVGIAKPKPKVKAQQAGDALYMTVPKKSKLSKTAGSLKK